MGKAVGKIKLMAINADYTLLAIYMIESYDELASGLVINIAQNKHVLLDV